MELHYFNTYFSIFVAIGFSYLFDSVRGFINQSFMFSYIQPTIEKKINDLNSISDQKTNSIKTFVNELMGENTEDNDILMKKLFEKINLIVFRLDEIKLLTQRSGSTNNFFTSYITIVIYSFIMILVAAITRNSDTQYLLPLIYDDLTILTILFIGVLLLSTAMDAFTIFYSYPVKLKWYGLSFILVIIVVLFHYFIPFLNINEVYKFIIVIIYFGSISLFFLLFLVRKFNESVFRELIELYIERISRAVYKDIFVQLFIILIFVLFFGLFLALLWFFFSTIGFLTTLENCFTFISHLSFSNKVLIISMPPLIPFILYYFLIKLKLYKINRIYNKIEKEINTFTSMYVNFRPPPPPSLLISQNKPS